MRSCTYQASLIRTIPLFFLLTFLLVVNPASADSSKADLPSHATTSVATDGKKPSQAEPMICPICHRANNPDAPYTEKAGATLVRGATNTAFGWTELLLQPASEVNSGGSLLTGIGKGVGFAVKRTAAGIGELFTFWTPKGKDGYLNLTTDCPVCMKKR